MLSSLCSPSTARSTHSTRILCDPATTLLNASGSPCVPWQSTRRQRAMPAQGRPPNTCIGDSSGPPWSICRGRAISGPRQLPPWKCIATGPSRRGLYAGMLGMCDSITDSSSSSILNPQEKSRTTNNIQLLPNPSPLQQILPRQEQPPPTEPPSISPILHSGCPVPLLQSTMDQIDLQSTARVDFKQSHGLPLSSSNIYHFKSPLVELSRDGWFSL